MQYRSHRTTRGSLAFFGLPRVSISRGLLQHLFVLLRSLRPAWQTSFALRQLQAPIYFEYAFATRTIVRVVSSDFSDPMFLLYAIKMRYSCAFYWINLHFATFNLAKAVNCEDCLAHSLLHL